MSSENPSNVSYSIYGIYFITQGGRHTCSDSEDEEKQAAFTCLRELNRL